MNNVRDRLQELRRIYNLTQRELAKRIGVTSQLVSMIETGKVQMSHLTAKAIEAEFGVNHEWILNGQGEMLARKQTISTTPLVSNELTAVLCYYPNIAKALNDIVKKMTLSDWDALNDFLSRNMQDKAEVCGKENHGKDGEG